MPKQLFSTTPSGATDALFRTWGSAHKAAMAAVAPSRFVQTADTGQIDWTTVTKPVAASTAAGYEVWKLSDSGMPDIYIKLTYGTSAASANVFALTAVTVGSGTNGAGTITGLAQTASLSTPPLASAGAGATGALSNSYIAVPAAGGSLVMVWNAASYAAAAITGLILVIDRTRDSAGAMSAAGAGVLFGGPAGVGPAMYVNMGALNFASPGVVAQSRPISILPDATQGANGSIVYVARHYVGLPAIYPLVAAVSYLNGEITQFTTFATAPVGSTSRTFMALGTTVAGNSTGNQSNSVSNGAAVNEALQTLAVVWED